MDKKTVRLKIGRLLDSCDGCPNQNLYGSERGTSYRAKVCGGCNVYEELNDLRSEIDRPQNEKYKHILEKGEEMTKNELMFLLENGVGIKHIKNSLNIRSQLNYYELLGNLGLLKSQRAQEMKV